jgi:hypothetical protein
VSNDQLLVLHDTATSNFITDGVRDALKIDGEADSVSIKPESVPPGFELYVQSTSPNCVLAEGYALIQGTNTSEVLEAPNFAGSDATASAKKKRKRERSDSESGDDNGDDAGQKGSFKMEVDRHDFNEPYIPPLKRALSALSTTLVKIDPTALPVEIVATVLAFGPLDLDVLHNATFVSKAWNQATQSAIESRLNDLVTFGSFF